MVPKQANNNIAEGKKLDGAINDLHGLHITCIVGYLCLRTEVYIST